VTLEVLTFGCRLNAVESEAMRAQAAADGLSDAVLVNTCAVTAEAVRQARQAIRRARRERPDAPILVTGCAAQTEPETFAAMPEVTRLIGNALKAAPGSYRLDPSVPRAAVGDIFATPAAPAPARPLKDRVRAHVAIQTGCDHRCTFCVIPYGRGDSRSVPAGEVVAQVRSLVGQGVQEVVLTGVDLTSWGADLPGTPPLGRMVRRILTLVPDLPRLRLSSIDAAEIDDDLLACFAEHERLTPYLHLSLQHGDDLILKRMKRRHLRADALRLDERVRSVRPDVAVGADLIAGFPTESEAAFANLVSLVEDAGLAFVHVFPFSPRPGTPAARMPQLARPLIKARAAALRAAADRTLVRHLETRVGRPVEALVENGGTARAPDHTPLAFVGDPGSLVRLTPTGHDGRRLTL
jgi:threonylcarbamoyladenosine tRNA methylthiotransferase MtaB